MPDHYRSLLLMRLVLLNASLGAAVAAAWSLGWLDHMIATDVYHLVKINIGIFCLGLLVVAWRAIDLSRELDQLRQRRFVPGSRGWAYMRLCQQHGASSRLIVFDALKLRIGHRIAAVRHIASVIVLVGLIGTIIGFIIALSGVSADAAADSSAIAPMVGTLMLGMGIALYKTLVGSILNVWLTLNASMLEGAAVHLVAGLGDMSDRPHAAAMHMIEPPAARAVRHAASASPEAAHAAIAALWIMLAAAPATAALAEGDCAERVILAEALRADYELAPQAYGRAAGNADRAFVQLYLNRWGGWAVVEHRRDGTACLLTRGTRWLHGQIGDRGP